VTPVIGDSCGIVERIRMEFKEEKDKWAKQTDLHHENGFFAKWESRPKYEKVE